jgi:F420-dependent oxidoreductase-like protein
LVKFGVVLPQYGVDYGTVREVAIECERLGFDSLWLEDHFMPWGLQPKLPTLECWITLASLAMVTSRIRLGTLCTCTSYRYPTLVAKMGATLDHISGGRLILGIGAGWFEEEYSAYGIPFPPPRERVRRLREAVQIIRKMWTSDKADYQGRYYRVRDAYCNPKPVQKPHPPIWIGGGGERLMLRVVAEVADGWNWGALTPEGYKRKLEVFEAFCRQVGREPGSIERSLELFVFIDTSQAGVSRRVDEYVASLAGGDRPQHLLRQFYLQTAVKGTPEQCVDALKQYVEAGVQHFTLVFPDAGGLESLRLFAREVIPAFKTSSQGGGG